MSRFLPFNARRWLASYEAAGGRFLIVGRGAITQAASAPPEPCGREALRWFLKGTAR